MEFSLPKREQFSNKGTFGKVLNIAGSENYPGAAYLSSISALRAGCGYVALSSSPKVINLVASMTPDLVYIPIIDVKNKLDNFDIISIGCGLSVEVTVSILFKSLLTSLSKMDKTVVLDADGLNLLAKMNENVSLPEKLIITPHPMEASRLLDVDKDLIVSKPIYYAKKLSDKYKCTTVLKMHSTVVCSETKDVYVNETGNSALAKAGSGDVLTGLITGFCAQGLSPFEAASLAVYLHGRAGEIAASMLSEYSVLASDLLKYIPLAIVDFAN